MDPAGSGRFWRLGVQGTADDQVGEGSRIDAGIKDFQEGRSARSTATVDFGDAQGPSGIAVQRIGATRGSPRLLAGRPGARGRLRRSWRGDSECPSPSAVSGQGAWSE